MAANDERTQDRDIATVLSLARGLQGETAMAKIQTPPWDAADYLQTEKDIVACLRRGPAGVLLAVFR